MHFIIVVLRLVSAAFRLFQGKGSFKLIDFKIIHLTCNWTKNTDFGSWKNAEYLIQ